MNFKIKYPCYRQTLLACIILLSFIGCKKDVSHITSNGFYYWDTHFHLDESDSTYLAQTGTNKLYIRLFDVGWNINMAEPLGNIYYESAMPSKLEIVPVVFITNECIKMLDSTMLTALAFKIDLRIKKEIQRTGINKQVKEIQIDCDWTNTTRNKYFHLLNEIKRYTSKKISATIRLHQYKYHEHNVPPVDKGLLMCYNVNDPADFNITNSLFDTVEIKKYTNGKPYPLPLDLALPVFSWGVRFKNKKFDGFTGPVTVKGMDSCSAFIKTKRKNVFNCIKDTFAFNSSFNTGELIRVEEAETLGVKSMAAFFKTRLHQDEATLILFRYDNNLKTLKNAEEISEIFQAGR